MYCFDLQSGNDLQVTGRANFVVIEVLTEEIGDKGKFLLLQWNDIANKPSQANSIQEVWSSPRLTRTQICWHSCQQECVMSGARWRIIEFT